MVVCMDNKFFGLLRLNYTMKEKNNLSKNNILIDSNNKEYIDLNSGTWNVFWVMGEKNF